MKQRKALSSALNYVGASLTPDDQLIEKMAGMLEHPAAHPSPRRRTVSLVLLFAVPTVFLSYYLFHAAAAETATSCFLNPYRANTGSFWAALGLAGSLALVGSNVIHYLASIALSVCGLLWAATWVLPMFTVFDRPGLRRVSRSWLKRSAIAYVGALQCNTVARTKLSRLSP